MCEPGLAPGFYFYNNPEINVEVLPAGIYFLNVSAQEGVQHLKFVKE
ncbi:T9SS type A sorting domain-containing protein [Flavobacterium suzhouense]|uniref:T9SS type A sorting domain-containing protein n=1 Tax=Flavobacterium suzhouense TaxID=1529638 RepID=A0ABW5NNT2_9FLAO